MPHTLRGIRFADENVAELSMLCAYDDDLANRATVTLNRFRGILTQIHRGLESVNGPHLFYPAIAALLIKYATPKALRRAGKHRAETVLRKHAPRAWKRWAAEVFTDLGEQSVVVSGTEAIGILLAQSATALAQTRSSRDEVLVRIEELIEAHRLFELLTSMPAAGARTTARNRTEFVGKEAHRE